MAQTAATFPERGYFLAELGREETAPRPLFDLIWGACAISDVRARFIPAVAAHFSARRAALMLFSEMPPDLEIPQQMRENPVLRYLFAHHAPVHEAVVVSPNDWSALCPWSDHGHVLSGPILQNGDLIGTLALTRERGAAAFDSGDLADASALCLHLSAWFCRQAGTASLPHSQARRVAGDLTLREQQITELVAQGLTNAQIGARLCVSSETVKANLKSIFRKTGVHSRAQLAARHLV